METVNKIHEGLHQDFNSYDQPANTMQDNRNGIIMDMQNGNYMWTNMKGTLLVFQIDDNDNIMRHCLIRDRLFIIVYNDVADYVILYELTFDNDGDITAQQNIWQGTNTILGLSLDHPITAMFGFYENDDIQRVYFTDNNSPPRVINIGSSGAVTLEEKFVNFSPIMEPAYGSFGFFGLTAGGNCKAGTYFFAWRLFKEDYYTDWSYLTTPVSVSPGTVGSWFDDYQKYEGGAPDENCDKKIIFTLGALDTDYSSIQVAAFYSNDYNSAKPGVLFYDGDITAALMVFYFVGNENLGTVTIDELMETTTVIETVKDMCHIKKMNILADVKEREEIDVSDLAGGKNSQIQVTMDYITKPILLDTRNYGDETYTDGQNKALCGIRDVVGETATHGLIPRIWYRADHGGVTFTDDLGARTIAYNDVFSIVSEDAVAITTGTVTPVIIKRLYKPNGAGDYNATLTGDDINESALSTNYISSGYYNYKNPVFATEIRGYPAGETVRLGVLFYDLTGRPFFVRHLYNLTTTWEGLTIGPGDFIVPRAMGKPDDPYKSAQIHNIYSYDAAPGEKGFKFAIGNVRGIEVSGLDITGIKDQIGAFSIVRCPIVRERLGYGILGHLLKDGNDVTLKPGFQGFDSDTDVWDKGYAFSCPEDLFGLTDFSIQPGDKIVNEYYLDPYDASEAAYDSYEGYGRKEQPVWENSYVVYQKYMEHTPVVEQPIVGNGVIETEHEVTYYTKFLMADDSDDSGIIIDPSDETDLFKEKTKDIPSAFATLYSRATNLGIVIFDELDGEGIDIKGIHNLAVTDPKLLMCSIKRENNNPYGGTGDSDIANSLYISTGHYQVINDAVLADIFDGSKYIFNNIEIFGGDAYIGMFDINRLLHSEDDQGGAGMSHSIIVPIESRINIDLREGNHIGKLRSWYSVVEPNGLRRKADDNLWEEFNYNDGYSSENINDYYLPMPYNFELENKFDTRLRYSIVKSYGEYEDSFRRFPALNYLDLATEYGSITNIRAKNNRLIYWQKDAVGYVPINERALSSANLGSPVQLGISGIFERHDEMITMIGNSNQFSLVESMAGFHWYDAVRKIFVTLGNDIKFSQDSIAKGLDSFFINDIPNNMDEYDNPIKDFGVIGGYDIRNKIVLMSFIMPGDLYETIAFNIKKNEFIGFHDYKARYYFNWKDWLYSFGNTNNIIYQHGTSTPGIYHGVAASMYFSIIIRNDSHEAKIFDNFEFIGSADTFTKLIYANSEQSTEELITSNKYITRRNKRWFGNFPLVTRERLVDGYLKITFYYEGTNEISFNELKTTFRKMI